MGRPLRRPRRNRVASVFDAEGHIEDETIKTQLYTLGMEVVRAAHRFAADATLHRHAECAQAAERVAAA